MKRELGEGRWDRILIRKMTELSVADNYNEAKDEWIATGDVWWNGNGDIPDWVSSSSHPNQCLCGHPIVYHFRIRNTENGIEEIVGSDHINSYLIMRQIAEEKGLVVGEVTDEQVAEWIKVRVGSMKAEAWWAENGDSFKLMFDKIKELDCWYNVHKKDWHYNSALCRTEPRRILRKKGKGRFGSYDYKMASIVWRWNHPDNPKNQFTVHGYPNAKLMQDLAYLYVTSDPLLEKYTKWKEDRIAKAKEVTDKREAQRKARAERQVKIEAQRIEADRIYNLPENVEKRARERMMREEERRIAREERLAREKAEEEKQIRRLNRRLSEPVTDIYAQNLEFLGVPILTLRVCDSLKEMKILSSLMRETESKLIDGMYWLKNCQFFLTKAPTVEQIKKLEALDIGIEYGLINRLEAEVLIQKEEKIDVKKEF